MKESNQNLGMRLNNPLNIRYNPRNAWRGQEGEERGFCKFENNAYGFRAAYIILTNYIKNGCNTLEDIISRWAPPCENKTENYIQFVSDECILPRDMVIHDRTIDDYWTKIIILRAMAKIETGQTFDEQQINLFINYPEKYSWVKK